MKHLFRFLYFLVLLLTIYILYPLAFAVFAIVYLFWNFKWIPKTAWNMLTQNWTEVPVGRFGKTICYPTPFDYLRKTNGRKTGWIDNDE